MSSSAEEESRMDSMVAKATEAVKDPFLRKIAIRIDSPSQVPKVCEILGLTNEEEKITKALVWLKKNEPEKYQLVLQSSEAENKEKRRKKMKTEWGERHFIKEFNKFFEGVCGYKSDLRVGSKAFNCFSSRFRKIWDYWFTPLGPSSLVAMEIRTEDGSIFSNGYKNLVVNVFEEKHLKVAQKFARAYEKKTGKKVKILRQY